MRFHSRGQAPVRGDSGQTIVMAAITLPVLVGMVGLAVDVGYAFDYRRQMQTAADSAAVAGAFAVKADGTISSGALLNVVNIDATQNGFANGAGGVTISVCRPAVDMTCPTTYTYSAGDGAVKVTITQPKPTFFVRVLSLTSLNIGTTAVAASANGGNTSNIVILDTACDNGLTVSGGSNLTLWGASM